MACLPVRSSPYGAVLLEEIRAQQGLADLCQLLSTIATLRKRVGMHVVRRLAACCSSLGGTPGRFPLIKGGCRLLSALLIVLPADDASQNGA